MFNCQDWKMKNSPSRFFLFYSPVPFCSFIRRKIRHRSFFAGFLISLKCSEHYFDKTLRLKNSHLGPCKRTTKMLSAIMWTFTKYLKFSRNIIFPCSMIYLSQVWKPIIAFFFISSISIFPIWYTHCVTWYTWYIISNANFTLRKT